MCVAIKDYQCNYKLYHLCKNISKISMEYFRNIFESILSSVSSPCIVLSTSIFCAFSLCRKTYNISPPIFKYRMGVECKDIFAEAIFIQQLLSAIHVSNKYTYVLLKQVSRCVVLTT